MKIKTKLNIGIGLLFLMILMLAFSSTWYVSALKKDGENILAANYLSVEYARNMLEAADQWAAGDSQALKTLQINLSRQQKNVTEITEREITDRLTKKLNLLQEEPNNYPVAAALRKELVNLMNVNMAAIVQKNDHVRLLAKEAFLLISILGALSFLIAFVLWMNLPSNIADPIKKLTLSIREIANQNYAQRLYFKGDSEFVDLASSFNSMAERLQEYANSKLDTILQEKKRVEALVNSIHDPVIGLNDKQEILFINDEALLLTGLSRNDIESKGLKELATGNELVQKIIEIPDKESVNSEVESLDQTISIYTEDKESFFEKQVYPIAIVPTGEQTLQHVGEVIILKNVTSFKELDVAKTNFIATVSHELKTPIASIQMGLELMNHPKTGALTENQKKLMEGIRDDSERLLRITSELLNMSQLETGNIKLFAQWCNPMPVITYALQATHLQAEQKQIELITQLNEDLPEVFIDEEKTAWVLTNFITNAIRYSPERSQIIVSLIKKDSKLIFSVQDHGKGIDSSYKDRIFDRYFQIPGSMRSGTGLGLSIAKDFIENQGGSIAVDSSLGVGSTFSFSIPTSKSAIYSKS
ncbi:HAMP domain-containing protein [Sphingobacterium sp. DK4209]|uniref:histidine kinase n=1 Tax=Sphingobacterium zhuxiongii TaxID=2662364 RepID=A0A5Q0QF07_9SPHI|nr:MULTISPECIES: ATP-binding protein [unclassified Sphingobacterium]MVZ65265.1 HAMP domain-containing protein [Sphingobacterium sp. DK4209]QGA26358.1 HAMP domain-containing protein [Sphingobacterium sp. dk4302]